MLWRAQVKFDVRRSSALASGCRCRRRGADRKLRTGKGSAQLGLGLEDLLLERVANLDERSMRHAVRRRLHQRRCRALHAAGHDVAILVGDLLLRRRGGSLLLREGEGRNREHSDEDETAHVKPPGTELHHRTRRMGKSAAAPLPSGSKWLTARVNPRRAVPKNCRFQAESRAKPTVLRD